jgi:hypothetical protein
MLLEGKEIVTQNLLFDHGVDSGGILELNSKVLEQHMKKHGCKF